MEKNLILEGYKTGYSDKKQADYFICTISSPCSGDGKSWGRNCVDHFIDHNVFKMLSPDMCGQPVTIDWGFNDFGRPRIQSISALVKK